MSMSNTLSTVLEYRRGVRAAGRLSSVTLRWCWCRLTWQADPLLVLVQVEFDDPTLVLGSRSSLLNFQRAPGQPAAPATRRTVARGAGRGGLPATRGCTADGHVCFLV